MVKLNIKKGDEAQFLYDTTVEISVDDLLKEIIPIYNGRLKVGRISSGMCHNYDLVKYRLVILKPPLLTCRGLVILKLPLVTCSG